MKHSINHWARLITVARQAPACSAACADEAPPPGFATRVAALAARAPSPAIADVFERMALRALGCAAAIMLISVVWSIVPTATAAALDDRSADLLDPVGEVLQLVQTS